MAHGPWRVVRATSPAEGRRHVAGGARRVERRAHRTGGGVLLTRGTHTMPPPPFWLDRRPPLLGSPWKRREKGAAWPFWFGGIEAWEKRRARKRRLFGAREEWSAAVASPERTCGCVRTPPDDSITAPAAGPTSSPTLSKKKKTSSPTVPRAVVY